MQEIGFSGLDGAASSTPREGTSHSRPCAFGKRFNLGWDRVGNTKEMLSEWDI